MHVVMHKPLCLSAFDMQNIALNFSEINAVFNIFLLFIVSAQQKQIYFVLREQETFSARSYELFDISF